MLFKKKDSVIVAADKLKVLLNRGNKSVGLKKCVCVCAGEEKDRGYC